MLVTNRVRYLFEKLAGRVDEFLVTSQPNLYYFSGIALEDFWLLLRGGGGIILSPPLLFSQIKNMTKEFEVLRCEELIEGLKASSKGKLGVDSKEINVSLFNSLREKFEIETFDGIIEEIRLIKDEKELGYIRKATSLTKRIINSLNINPGKTEEDVKIEIERRCLAQGVKIAFEPIIASGKNSAYPHHITSSDLLEGPVLIDMGCKYSHYCSDLTRMYFLGKKELKDMFSIVVEAQQAAINSIKEGVSCEEVYYKSVEVLKKFGYEKYFIHSLGHSIGLEVHEGFRLSQKNKKKLSSGMVLTVEPGVYIEGIGGVRVEDVVVVRKEGCEVL